MGSGDDRAQEPKSLGDTSSMQSSGNIPLSDRQSLESCFAELSTTENSPFQAYNALDIDVVAHQTEQEERREQYFNEAYSKRGNDDHEADNEIGPNKKLARGGRNQEALFALYRQQMIEGTGKQPPDLHNKQMTVQRSAAQRSSNDRLQTVDDPGPLPLIIDMHHVPLAITEISGSGSHHFVLSALTWLVGPEWYTIKHSVVCTSIPETSIILLGNTLSGKSSACKTHITQKPVLVEFDAMTLFSQDHKVQIPMIVDRSWIAQESIVNLTDTRFLDLDPFLNSQARAKDSNRLSRHADVIINCYPTTKYCVPRDSYVGTYPKLWYHLLNS